jgi:hypothetical protein
LDPHLELVDKACLYRLRGKSGPATAMSRSAFAFSLRTASGSKARSIFVRALSGSARVLE